MQDDNQAVELWHAKDSVLKLILAPLYVGEW